MKQETADAIIDGEAKVIYKNNKPYGIRDSGGFLFFFSSISKYTGQEERYRREIEQQYRLADFLLSALNSLVVEDEVGRAERLIKEADKVIEQNEKVISYLLRCISILKQEEGKND